MALLTTPQGHGPLLRAIVNHVGDAPADRPALLREFCPEATDEPALFRETLEVGATLGVLDLGRKVTVKRADEGADVAAILRSWLMSDATVGADLFADKARGASDLVRGMCWLLTQDPADGPISTKDFEARQRGLSKEAIVNVEQYRAVARWSCWTGIATMVAQRNFRILPNLTTVVRDCLPASGASVPVTELEANVAKALPVAPGGWIRTRYDDVAGAPDSLTISPVMSYALEVLRDAKEIDLRVAEDAAIGGQQQRLLAGSRRPVTDVEVLG